jgi:UDP-N-acetyl-D-mannosaminuronic acid dehydrogenase
VRQQISSVCVVGLGYIGLPTAAMLASRGLAVIGVDTKPSTLGAVANGETPFVEPDLAELVRRAVAAGSLTVAAVPAPADAFVIAVPTPVNADRSPDLSHVFAAVDSICPVLRPGALVVLESTSPPGTTARVAQRIAERRPDLAAPGGDMAVEIAYCPERVLPGRVVHELRFNDRIVGGLTPRAASRAGVLYRTFCEGEIMPTDAVTAEMAKLVENAFRDVNIAFANELSVVCENLGVDVRELIALANHHPRVSILSPGPGVGGHCIAVDPWFIAAADPASTRLIQCARRVNDSMPAWVGARVEAALAETQAPTVVALGLAFKANIDDLRQSPAREVVARLAQAHPDGVIRVVEPHVSALPAELAARSNVELVSFETAFAGADAVVLLVDHDAFRTRPPDLAPDIPVIDTRGLWR